MMRMRLLDNARLWFGRLKQKKSMTVFDVAIFLRQLTTLISAGIPIIQSCEIIAKGQENHSLCLLIDTIKRDLLTGKNLFYCLRRHPRYFDELTCQLIQIGEQTGKLDTMLQTISNYHEQNQALKRSIKQALFYPCIIITMSIIITICMLIFVIPRFAELFQDTQDQLPFITICIFSISLKLQKYFWLLIMTVILFTLLLLHNKHSHIHCLQRIAIQLPIVQLYFHKIVLIRFARYLALTIAAGVPITNALLLIAPACGSTEFTNTVIKLNRKITAGVELHQAMRMLVPFSTFMIQMVKIGEESGMLENMLNKFAEFTEADVAQHLQRLNLLLEPLIMVVLGVLIGGLVIGMYLPIFKLGSAI